MTQKQAIQTSTIPMPTAIVESLELLAQINKIDDTLSEVAIELAEIVKQEAANNQYFYVTK